MGAEQSTTTHPSAHHQPQQIRKTETADFDFRYDGKTIQRSFLLESSESRNEGRQENKENRDKNYYWLEVGMDVVKKSD